MIIPICFICDKKFVMPTAVAITSLIKNKYESTQYHIFIIAVDCEKQDFDKYNEFENTENVKIDYIFTSDEKYANINQKSHISRACLLKFEICDLIPIYDKLLYLDGDIIVQDDLTEFYEIELQGKYLAGPYCLSSVLDGGYGGMVMGSFIIDAAKMREIGASRMLIAHRMKKGDTPSMDGVTYNEVFENNMMPTSFIYGLTVDKLFYDRKYYTLSQLNDYYKTDYKSRNQILENSTIIHYTGGEKPWKYSCFKGVKIWDRYYKMSPYRDDVLIRYNFADYMKKRVNQYGIKGIWYYIKDKLLEIMGSLGMIMCKFDGYGWY